MTRSLHAHGRALLGVALLVVILIVAQTQLSTRSRGFTGNAGRLAATRCDRFCRRRAAVVRRAAVPPASAHHREVVRMPRAQFLSDADFVATADRNLLAQALELFISRRTRLVIGTTDEELAASRAQVEAALATLDERIRRRCGRCQLRGCPDAVGDARHERLERRPTSSLPPIGCKLMIGMHFPSRQKPPSRNDSNIRRWSWDRPPLVGPGF